jgi:thiamine-phosphate pyrophosphorylase
VIVDLSVYLVTDSALAAAHGADLVDVVEAAIAGGVTAVQVREKHATSRAFLDLVVRLARAVPPSVALLVNDRVDVFLAARAMGSRVAGVHLGQSDLPVAVVRELVGPEAVIGLSAATNAELLAAAAEPAGIDYVGIGALHATPTKLDAPEPLGLPEFARLAALTDLPAVAIGGVGRTDMPLLRAAGAAGGAVVSAVFAAPDPGEAARELAEAWRAAG